MRAFSARKTIEQRRGHQHERRPRGRPAPRAAERREACRDSERLRRSARASAAEPEEQRRLGQRGEEGLAAGAHALEARTGVQRGGHREEPHQPQQVGEQQKSPGKASERRDAAQRQQRQAGQRRRPSPTIGPARNTQVVVWL